MNKEHIDKLIEEEEMKYAEDKPNWEEPTYDYDPV